MKTTALLLLCFIFTANFCSGQNLVPNPSFEEYSGCPQSTSEISKATGWFSSSGSPDYFNVCANTITPYLGIPHNFCGEQVSLGADGAYSGLLTYQSAPGVNSRECISARLNSNLVIGVKYFVSMYVSRCDSIYTCATNNLGIRFTISKFQAGINPIPINNISHVNESGIITDNINWVKVSGSFTADSAYEYINIGNFYDDLNTDTFQCPTNENISNYYFVDRICVSTDSASCQLTTNLDSYPQQQNLQQVFSFPNPVDDFLYIKNIRINTNVSLVNHLGEIVLSEKVTSAITTMEVSNIKEGMLFLCLDGKAVSRVIINH